MKNTVFAHLWVEVDYDVMPPEPDVDFAGQLMINAVTIGDADITPELEADDIDEIRESLAVRIDEIQRRSR